MQIGAQLYTLFRQANTLEGFETCLKKVAGMGYKVVQVSGTCAYEPEWLRDKLVENNLKCVITHIDTKRISEETEKVVSEHRIFGCNHIGIGGMPNEMRGSLEGYKEFKKIFLPAALKMRDMGAKLMYHNHWFEFTKIDGLDVIERLAEDFPEDALGFTLDLGWAAHAGSDVVKLINDLKGRLPIIHLKDYKRSTSDMVDLLAGDVDYITVKETLDKIGYDNWLTAEMIPPYAQFPETIIYNTSKAMDAILGRN